MSAVIQVPTAKFRTWSQRGIYTDGGYNAGLRDTNIYTPELLPPKGNHQKGAKGSQKGAKGAKREPKEAKREPKIKKIIKNHVLESSKFSFFCSLVLFFKIVKTVMVHL